MSKSNRAVRAAEQWRKERPDLDAFPMELLGQLAEAYQLISQNHLAPLFTEHDLHMGEFDVLATLRRAGPPYELTPTALHEATMVTSGGMTNRLNRLESSGLIERKRNPADRRGSLVSLTPKGFQLIDRLVEAHVENERGVLSCLTRSEQEKLNQLLEKLVNNLRS